MPYVDGDVGLQIKEQYERSLDLNYKKNYREELDLLLATWDLIPEEKYSYSESFLIAVQIVKVALATNDLTLMNTWKDAVSLSSPHRIDSGERDMILGKIAYHNGDIDEAKSLFVAANKKSKGRCFSSNDQIYKDLMEGRFSAAPTASASDNPIVSRVTELGDDAYDKIAELCESADALFDKRKYSESISLLLKAWDILPLPKENWEAAGWIKATLGDNYFFAKDYSAALECFEYLYTKYEMINEFVLVRLGGCYFELGEIDQARKYLFDAYMMAGKEIFDHENEKYLQVIEDII